MKPLLTLAETYLATRRITTLMTSDKITEPAREWVWKHHGPEETRIGYVFTCRKCSSVWAAGAALALSTMPGGGALLRVLALSEASILTDAVLPPELDL